MSQVVEKYRINWKMKETGFQSFGEFCFNRIEDVMDSIKQLNKEYPEVEHWVGVKCSNDNSDSPSANSVSVSLDENSSEAVIGLPK